jgi:hypothetical protein
MGDIGIQDRQEGSNETNGFDARSRISTELHRFQPGISQLDSQGRRNPIVKAREKTKGSPWRFIARRKGSGHQEVGRRHEAIEGREMIVVEGPAAYFCVALLLWGFGYVAYHTFFDD